jgi:integrase
MPKLKNGLYKPERRTPGKTVTWHFQIRFQGKAYGGDTGQTAHAVAKEWLAAYRANLAKQAIGWIVPEDVPTLEAALAQWVFLRSGQVSDYHLQAVQTSVLVHCGKHLKKRLTEITNPVVESIRSDYLSHTGKGFRGATHTHTSGGANTVVKHLRLLLRSFISTSMYDVRPLKEMPFDVQDLPSQEEAGSVLWPEQVPEFLSKAQGSCTPDAYTAIVLMLLLGLREDEALSSRWECVSWTTAEYVITGDRALNLSTKNRRTRRIPINSWLLNHLKQRWEQAGKPKAGLLLCQRKGTKRSRGYTRKPVALCAKALGLHRFHPHALRRAYATGHFEAGTPLSQLQQMMGHSSTETTLEYIIQRPYKQAEAQESLADRMGLVAKSHPEIEYCI